MKKFTLFESSIIGFFCGVIVAAYMAFVTGTDGFIGTIVSWVSLKPLLDMFSIPDASLLVVSFLFFIVVYTIYGALIGLIFKKNSTAGFGAVALALMFIVGASFEQVKGAATHISTEMTPVYVAAAVIDARPKTPALPQQYFGTEARGDLNADGKDDVAFLISRNDQDRGILYYLVASLAFDGGYQGTNLIFLGEKLDPRKLSIDNGLIGVEYATIAQAGSTTTSMMYARVTDGVLEKSENLIEQNTP